MRSPLCYIGGKSRLAATIIEEIPEHTTYCEVFAGACWVLFTKEPSKYEIINDINSDLVVFWRVVQNHLEEFFRQFKYLLVSREWFEDWRRQAEAGGLTDTQRAARFYYLQRCAFGGKVLSRTFGSSPIRLPRINLLRLEEELSEVHLRLARVTIEHLPWSGFVRRYDRPGTFFYLDPPYFDCEHIYGDSFERRDFAAIAEQLSSITGKFLLSINDVPFIRDTFKGFNTKQVRTTYTVGGDNAQRVQELLISNF